MKKGPKQKKTISILIANGVNLDLLGTREPKHYGKQTLAEIEAHLKKFAQQNFATLYPDFSIKLNFFQTNHEGIYLEKISGDYDGLVLNPGAWTHTSLALADRLTALQIPYVEVHLSNLAARSEKRRESFVSAGARCVIYGAQAISYEAGLVAILSHLNRLPSK